MILSRGRRYVFVHIPKTGGTSLARALEARAMKDDILIGDTPKARARRRRQAGLTARGRLWKHSTLADIEGLLPQEDRPSSFGRSTHGRATRSLDVSLPRWGQICPKNREL